MRVRLVVMTIMLFFCTQSLFALTGREIMDKSNELKEPDTMITKSLMIIHKGKRVREKEFEMMRKKYSDGEDKALASFIRPTRMKFLMHTHKDAENDQWLRMSSGKVKRIAGADRSGSFMNSHFTYEDMDQMGSIKLDDYNYKNLGDGKANGDDCYLVEAIAKDKTNKKYEKTVIYVRKSDFFPVRMDIYEDGKITKTLEQLDIKVIDGIITPHQIVMSLADGQGKTVLKMETIEYNKDIPDSTFNKEALR